MFRPALLGLVVAATGCGSVAGGDDDGVAADAAPASDAAGPDARPLTWSAFEEVGIDFSSDVRVPVVTEDRLNLYFSYQTSVAGDYFDLYSASRATTADPFGTATAVPVVNVAAQEQRYPEVSGDGLELYFSTGDTGPIMVSTRPNLGAAFSAPVAVGTGVVGNFASLSGDKLTLYFIAQLSGINGELRYVTRASVGGGWSTPTAITLTGAVEIYSSIEVSRDELAILRAPPLGATSNHELLINRRASRSDPFTETEVLPVLDPFNTAFASARFSANDTEIWAGQAVGGTERPHVSYLR